MFAQQYELHSKSYPHELAYKLNLQLGKKFLTKYTKQVPYIHSVNIHNQPHN